MLCFDTSFSWCPPQFSSVLQNVQALREQTLMLVHGTADGKMAWVGCSKLTASTKTHRSLGGCGPKVVNQEIKEMRIDRGNNLAVKDSFKIWDLFPSSQIPIGSSFPGRIHNMLTYCFFSSKHPLSTYCWARQEPREGWSKLLNAGVSHGNNTTTWPGGRCAPTWNEFKQRREVVLENSSGLKKANFDFQIEVIYFGSQVSGLDVVVLITCKWKTSIFFLGWLMKTNQPEFK